MTEKIDGRFTATSPKIMIHPHLHQASSYVDKKTGRKSDKPEFSASFVMEANDPDFAAMKAIVARLVADNFPGEKVQLPFKSGTMLADERVKLGKNDGEFMRGKIVLKAASGEQYPPALGGVENGRAVDYDTTDKKLMSVSKFFFGAEAFFQVVFKEYKVGSNTPGVKAYLSKVFVTGKGEKLTSGASAAETFGAYMGQASNVNPLEDLDIPY